MKADELPLLELFTRLRQAGLPLGINEYQLVLQALQSGFGIPDRQALARLCRTLWVKSEEDQLLFNYHFEQVMAEDEARLVPADELLPVPPESDLPKNFLISWWRRISLPTRFALGGTLILVAWIGISLGKSDTQTFNQISNEDSSAFQTKLNSWLITLGFISVSLVALVLPGGYIIARWIAERNAKPPDFPPLPEPKEETPTAISALNQGLEDEVQVAQAVHQGIRRDTDLPLSAFTETSEYFPVTGRQMKQSWRYLRRLIREGPPIDLDVEATVNQISREGMLLHPVLRPRRVNRNELLLLVDQDGSMAPFHSLSERLAKTAIHGGRLARAGIYYFHNCPSQYLYRDPYHQVAEPISEVLSRLHSEYAGVLIFSDAGAARGSFNRERLELTAEFLHSLRQQLRYIAWLNPMPCDRWMGTAGEIAKLVPMFALSRQGLNQAIDVLRGKPTHQRV